MAIVQVSRLTQRKGLQEDLPQPLASAELGWAIDQRRLFIGNGTLAEGAPVVGNTEILTEFSDLLSFTSTYTYQGEAAGYIVQTGESAGTPITTSLQRRLDYIVSVKEFGAVGTGDVDDSDAINRALYELFCRQTNTQVRRGLFLPAGKYKITKPLLIPPYCVLYGEGPESSQIYFHVDNWVSGTAYDQGTLIKYNNLYYRADDDIPAGTIVTPDTGGSGWTLETLSSYVLRTTDNNQQYGVNIGINGATPPTDIGLYSLEVITTQHIVGGGHDILLLDRCKNLTAEDVIFTGPLEKEDLTTSNTQLSSVRVQSTTSYTIDTVNFNRCVFRGTTWAFNTDNATKSVTISNGRFDTLYQGAVVGDSSPVNGGPSGVRIVQCVFDNIYNEGIIFDTVSLNASAFNTFLDVGNHFLGVENPATSIITINADNNVSIGDMFARTEAQEISGYPRIKVWNSSTGVPAAIALTNGQILTLGSYNRKSGLQSTLTSGNVNTELFTVDGSITRENGGFSTFVMDYNISRETATSIAKRRGKLTVVTSATGDSAISQISYDDEYTETETTDVRLSVDVNTGTGVITVYYTADATGYDATIYYSLNYLD